LNTLCWSIFSKRNRGSLAGLLQQVELELEPELMKPCFLAPPAPSKQLGKELQLSGALPLEPVVSAPIWQGSCRSRRWSRSRSPAKDPLKVSSLDVLFAFSNVVVKKQGSVTVPELKIAFHIPFPFIALRFLVLALFSPCQPSVSFAQGYCL